MLENEERLQDVAEPTDLEAETSPEENSPSDATAPASVDAIEEDQELKDDFVPAKESGKKAAAKAMADAKNIVLSQAVQVGDEFTLCGVIGANEVVIPMVVTKVHGLELRAKRADILD